MSTERTPNGRFAAGNRGGPGNPFARQTAALRQALLDAVAPEDMAQIAAALLVKAKCGDVRATKLLFSYLLGKPATPSDPDRLDREEWRQFREEKGDDGPGPRHDRTARPELAAGHDPPAPRHHHLDGGGQALRGASEPRAGGGGGLQAEVNMGPSWVR